MRPWGVEEARSRLAPRGLRTRTQVQVWQGERVTLLHGVALESDTLRGVPFTQSPTCDSCAVRIALETVDSLRVGSRERAFFRSAGLALAVGSVWGYLVRDIGGN